MKVLVLLAAISFSLGSIAWGQWVQNERRSSWMVCEAGLCIFPPVVGMTPGSEPNRSFVDSLREFHRLYVKSLRNKLSTFDEAENLWWLMVILRPGCEKGKWCIEVNVAEEKRGARPILITRIALSGEKGFDAEVKAEEAAEKTKIVIFPSKKPKRQV